MFANSMAEQAQKECTNLCYFSTSSEALNHGFEREDSKLFTIHKKQSISYFSTLTTLILFFFNMTSNNTQVALITGCSSGIGKFLAISLSKRNFTVYATARNVTSLDALTKNYNNIKGLRLDVCDEESIKLAVDEIIKNEGKVDILINNAGMALTTPAAESDIVKVKKMFDTNVIGLMAVVNEVFPHMATKKSGKIVNIGSVAGFLSTPFLSQYSATKAAVQRYTDGLRIESKPFGVQVMLVTPGFVKSEIGEKQNSYVKSNGLYTPFKEKFFSQKPATGADSKVATPTDVFAEDLVAAIDQKVIAYSYRAGGMSLLAYIASFFPTWLQIRLLSSRDGFNKITV
ncbi:hypothetical protein HK099_005656 [Clydaea vesicula]|uniref:Uncharacterized protein n=1 Tax=Clydaea vesicula TaxID=447962 RepID=A0AAD5XUS8_9FUNG|nr:hypothetical protein HK099_005656 [Clydaea vesicula]KAJ3397312.1 hypothetical protein HDU92_008853 [Lobulomyces angularis]